MSQDQPLLHFNFLNSKGSIVPYTFMDPITIIQTNDPNEIIESLHNVQKEVAKGYYAAGYVAYEAAAAFYPNLSFKQQSNLPLLWFGIFEKPKDTSMNSQADDSYVTSPWKPTVSLEDYNHAFERIHSYIKDSETEQVNYTIQMEAQFSGDSFAFYKQLEQSQASNYSAYLHIDQKSILSASPELFFHVKDNTITTKPMKGTVGRGKTFDEDVQHADWLKQSPKNRHENELIVKLMKSELEKIAQPHTIAVPKRFEIEQYPTVYQMTSTITAELQQNLLLADLFQALFPCGSITGLPKDRTIEIITELEQNPRGIYCGAIGYITPDHEAIFNVPIRTVLIDHETEKASYGVGGAITIDSTKEDEYEEIITKAKVLTEKQTPFQLLETLGLRNGEYIVLDHHIERMKQSASYFNYPFNEAELYLRLQRTAEKHTNNSYIVRVLLHKDGVYSIDVNKHKQTKRPALVSLAKQPIDKNDHFLYHKTTNRALYNKHREELGDLFDVLLWNEDEQITEFTTGNIVVEFEDEFITPPTSCGLLPGTFRKSLLDQGKITEKIITKNDLKFCKNIWFINSVRQWIPVKIVY